MVAVVGKMVKLFVGQIQLHVQQEIWLWQNFCNSANCGCDMALVDARFGCGTNLLCLGFGYDVELYVSFSFCALQIVLRGCFGTYLQEL